MSRKPPDLPEWNGFDGLDKLLDHRVRLAVCVLLSRYKTLSFRRLRELLEESDGSLGTHLGKLESANYLSTKKEFQNRRPITWYSLTRQGRASLKSHISGLQELLSQAKTPKR